MRRLYTSGRSLVILVPFLASAAALFTDRGPDGGLRVGLFPAALVTFDPVVRESMSVGLSVAAATALTAWVAGAALARIPVAGGGPLTTLATAVPALSIALVVRGLLAATATGRTVGVDGDRLGWWLTEFIVGMAYVATTSAAFGTPSIPDMRSAAKLIGLGMWRLRLSGIRADLRRAAGPALAVFGWTLFEPAGPLVFGCRNTPAAQLVLAAWQGWDSRVMVLAWLTTLCAVPAIWLGTRLETRHFGPARLPASGGEPQRTTLARAAAWCWALALPLGVAGGLLLIGRGDSASVVSQASAVLDHAAPVVLRSLLLGLVASVAATLVAPPVILGHSRTRPSRGFRIPAGAIFAGVIALAGGVAGVVGGTRREPGFSSLTLAEWILPAGLAWCLLILRGPAELREDVPSERIAEWEALAGVAPRRVARRARLRRAGRLILGVLIPDALLASAAFAGPILLATSGSTAMLGPATFLAAERAGDPLQSAIPALVLLGLAVCSRLLGLHHRSYSLPTPTGLM